MENKKNSIRLQAYLSRAGIASRRKCEEYVLSGSVAVNGKIITSLGTKVSKEDTVTFNGKKVSYSEQKIYVAVHKPPKYLCSNKDPEGRPLVIDLLRPVFGERLFHVGRLDYMTSGLIFYTNDGEFSKRITHPKNKVEKEYIVVTKKEIPESLLLQFKRGIYVQGELFRLKSYSIRGARKVHLVLSEGKNREIRKVLLSKNIQVKKIHRIRIGSITIKGIKPGHFRKLSDKEVARFYHKEV